MKSQKSTSKPSVLAAMLLTGSVLFAFPLLAQSQATPRAARPQPPRRAATPAATPSATPDTGTLTSGNVVYTPQGCVHNGVKAVCTFTFINQGAQGMMKAGLQLFRIQFVDDAHVPHPSDAAYFIDNYGARQPQLFVNTGDTGTLIREFVNVDARVASGEFHLARQAVGGIPVGVPGAAPAQVPATAVSPAIQQPLAQPATTVQPATAIQPVTAAPAGPIVPASTTTSADPLDKAQQGVTQVNAKKKKAQSLWDQMKTIKK